MYYKLIIYLTSSCVILGIFFVLLFALKKYYYKAKKNITDEDDIDYDSFSNSHNKKPLKKNIFLIKEHHSNKTAAESIENIRIVGITKPIGKWTRFVMSEKLQRMVGLNLNKTHKGFWQMLIKLEAPSQGKNQGRSRGNSRSRK